MAIAGNDRLYTAEEVLEMLRQRTRRNSIQWLADEIYCSPECIYLTLERRRKPGAIILNYLGLEEVILYRLKHPGRQDNAHGHGLDPT